MRSPRPIAHRLLLCAPLTLALAGCSTQRAIDVVPEVRVERVTIPPDQRRCVPVEGITAGQTQADIGRDLVTVTAALVACDTLHARLVATLEAKS